MARPVYSLETKQTSHNPRSGRHIVEYSRVDLHSFNEPLNCGIASARSAPLDAFFEGWKGRGDFEYSKREMARIVMGKPAMKDRNPFGSHQIMWY